MADVHTPWTLDGDHDWSECSVDFGGTGSHYTVYEPGRELPVAFVIGTPGNRHDDEDDRARARLIAAAPELLEALVEAKKALWIGARDQWTMADFKNWAVVQQIDEALDKARAKASSKGPADE